METNGAELSTCDIAESRIGVVPMLSSTLQHLWRIVLLSIFQIKKIKHLHWIIWMNEDWFPSSACPLALTCADNNFPDVEEGNNRMLLLWTREACKCTRFFPDMHKCAKKMSFWFRTYTSDILGVFTKLPSPFCAPIFKTESTVWEF